MKHLAPKSWPFWLWLLLPIVFAVELWRYRGDVRFDDSFMFIRYANNLLETGTYGWNPGEKTFGCTSIPYTFFICLLKWLGAGNILKSSLLLLSAAVFWALAAFIMMERLFAHILRSSTFNNGIVSKLMVLFIIVNPFVIRNVVTGMDTSMSLFFNTLMIYSFFRYVERPCFKRALPAAFFSYFIFLVRPDNGIYSILFPIAFLFYHRFSFKQVSGILGMIVFFIAVDTFIKYLYFGNPLPLPFYAKTKGFYNAYTNIYLWNNLEYMFGIIVSTAGILIIANLLIRTRTSTRPVVLLLAPVVATFAYLFTILQIMGTEGRYYIPSIPFLLSALLLGVIKANNIFFPLTARNFSFTLIAGALCLVGIFVVTPIYHERQHKRELTAARRFPVPKEIAGGPVVSYPFNVPMTEIFRSASALCKSLPEGSVVAATEYGYIGAENPHVTIIDLCGLHNKDLALRGWSEHILKNGNPDFIWMPPQGYVGLWYTIINDPYFVSEYELCTNSLRYGVAIRKNSPNAFAIREKLQTLNGGAILSP